MEKIRLAVIFGGRACEHDVSIVSALQCMDAVNAEEYEVIPVYIARDGAWYTGAPLRKLETLRKFDPGMAGVTRVYPDVTAGSGALLTVTKKKGLFSGGDELTVAARIDVAMPVLHGMNGEDGTLQGLLELARLPYVGCGVTGSANCMDKDIAKRLFAAAGIPTARGFTVYRGEVPSPAELAAKVEAELGWPVFVKPVNLGSSVGVSRACDAEELAAAMEEALRYDCKVLVEEAITGAEVECAVMGNHHNAIPSDVIGEIVPLREMYDYEGKYLDGSTQLYIPARIPAEQTELIRQAAVKAYRALDCRGLSRVDFFALPDGTIRLNEINTLPGFTNISMFPKLFMASGYTYPQLLDRLIELALEPR